MSNPKQARYAALSSFVGTVLEWYDFYIYSTAGALVFGKLFFPTMSTAAATMATFASLGVGFFARPLGAIIFGHIGDRFSRKQALVLTLVVMGAMTVLIGLVPTYASIGLWAPAILVALRFLQGIAVGGEWGGAALMAVEHAPSHRRGLYASGVQAGAPGGLLLGTGVFLLVTAVTSDEQFLAWGWRIPFLVSLVVLGLGLFIRLKLAESPEFAQAKQDTTAVATVESRLPLWQAFRHHPGAFLKIFGLRSAELTSWYIATVFILSYATQHFGVDENVMLTGNMIVAGLSCVAIPFFAMRSDIAGRRPVYVLGSLIGVVVAVPLFLAVSTANAVLIWLAMIALVNFGHNPVSSVQPPLFTEMFSLRLRYSGAGFAYQVAGAVIGGLTPLAAAALAELTAGGWVYVAALLAVMCAISASVALRRGDSASHDKAAPAAATLKSER